MRRNKIKIPLSEMLKEFPYPPNKTIKQEILKAGKKRKNVVTIPCPKLLGILISHRQRRRKL